MSFPEKFTIHRSQFTMRSQLSFFHGKLKTDNAGKTVNGELKIGAAS